MISIDKIFYAGCKAVFTHKKRPHYKGRKIILTGTREKATVLWRVPLENKNPHLDRYIEHRINSKYHMINQTYLVKYLNAVSCIPVKSTYIESIQKVEFQSWHGLTVKLANKYLPKSVDTEKVHIDQSIDSNYPLYITTK